MNSPEKILVAGLGNIFFGDDAFGSEVAGVLRHMHWPAHVRVEDFGIRSYDLAYALMEADAAILIDAVPRGQPPGTIYLIEPDLEHLGEATPDAHTMNPVAVLQLVRSLGGTPGRVFLVGCEPAALECDEGQLGLSHAVEAAVPEAVALVERVIADLIYNRNPTAPAFAGQTRR
ncbi:MAG TPA: hydrogenase maturation protease [Candidatus Methylacidiphilales bacterium]|jgi:hydrogenase maturation protease|nr:hydrogenase maturation protease [Candidatus Methylacidiphilales bacterium]